MIRQPLQTKLDITNAVNNLCVHFGVNPPQIVFNNGRRSRAGGTKMTMGMNDWQACADHDNGLSFDLTFAVLHEFGHVVNYQKKTRDLGDPHGPAFFRWLVKIIQYWYGSGNEAQYQWHNDYYKVYSQAKFLGWTNQEWFVYAIRRARLEKAQAPVIKSLSGPEPQQLAATPAVPRAYRLVSRPYTGQRVMIDINGQDYLGRIEWQRGPRMRVRVRLDAGGLVVTPCLNLKTNSTLEEPHV